MIVQKDANVVVVISKGIERSSEGTTGVTLLEVREFRELDKPHPRMGRRAKKYRLFHPLWEEVMSFKN